MTIQFVSILNVYMYMYELFCNVSIQLHLYIVFVESGIISPAYFKKAH